MAKVSSLFGSFTITGWNLLSSAASFSIYKRYSLIVVAQITLIDHLARAGFSMFHMSIDHSVFHAQTTMWISSMKRIIFQSDFSTSLRIAFSLSSKSHLYLLPAMSAHMSSSMILLSFRESGTSHLTISCARSSIIAVFQTPGSQTSTGLFFVLRERI